MKQQIHWSVNDLETVELILECPLRFLHTWGGLIIGKLISIQLLSYSFSISLDCRRPWGEPTAVLVLAFTAFDKIRIIGPMGIP